MFYTLKSSTGTIFHTDSRELAWEWAGEQINENGADWVIGVSSEAEAFEWINKNDSFDRWGDLLDKKVAELERLKQTEKERV